LSDSAYRRIVDEGGLEMKKIHVLAVAFLLGVAAVFGVLAATRTAGVGAAAHARVSKSAIAVRSNRLNMAERALRRALKDRPPALPAVPAASRSAQTPQIVYRRPAPLIVLAHGRSHTEHETEHEARASDD
jgi:hypothetical protein